MPNAHPRGQLQRRQSAKKRALRRPVSQTMRLERRILAMLAFFSISAGLWANFRQLWLQDNGYTAAEISTLTSIATFLSVGGILLVGARLKLRSLRGFMLAILILRLFAAGLQLCLYRSGQNLPVDLCAIFEIFTGFMIVASIYPLLTTVIKNNKVYSKRKLVEYVFRDVGVFVGGLLIGKHMVGLGVDYNTCLGVSMAFLTAAILIMLGIRTPAVASTPARRASSTLKYILNSKIQSFYMLYALLASMSFATVLGLKILVLTNLLDLTASTATDYLLIAGLVGDVIGVLALKYFTPQNDYITVTLKFGIRFGAYAIAALANDPFIFFLALTWALFSETAYEDVCDGHYINLVDNQHQLSYNTIKHVMSYSGEAIGILLGGWLYAYGLSAMLTCSVVIMGVQISIAYYLIHLRRRRHRVRHSASRLRYEERLAGE